MDPKIYSFIKRNFHIIIIIHTYIWTYQTLKKMNLYKYKLIKIQN